MRKIKYVLLAAVLAATSCLVLPGDLTNTAEAAGYVRPFGDNAPWNRPVRDENGNQLIPTHPNSNTLRSLHWNHSPSRPGNFNLNAGYSGFTYPVYKASDATGIYPVVTNTGWGNMNGRTIPWNPAWQPADDSDGQVIVIDTVTGREWDLWRVSFDPMTQTVYADNANLVTSSKENVNAGVDPNPYAGNYYTKENGFIPSRGAGIQYLAMLVGPDEIRAGKIEHALSMPVKNTSHIAYVPPATDLEYDDPVDETYRIPEGTRFALNVTDQEIEAWLNTFPANLPNVQQTKNSMRIIAKALRDYGWFITDTTTGGAHIQLEDYHSAGADWIDLGLGYDFNNDGIAEGIFEYGEEVYPRNLLDGLMQESRIYALVPSDQYPPVSDPLDIAPLADSYVTKATPNANFGSLPMLRIKDAPNDNLDRIAYFKFDLSNVPKNHVASAKLRVYCTNLFNGSPTYAKAFRVSDDSWLEYAINWNNKPALGAQEGSQVTFNAAGAWYEFDVTGYVQSVLNYQYTDIAKLDDRVITIALMDNLVTNKSIDLGSRESQYKPVLRIDTTP